MIQTPDIRFPTIRNLPVDPHDLEQRLQKLLHADAKRFRRLWTYYRNPIIPAPDHADASADRPYRQGQEWGLPPRITGLRRASDPSQPGEPLDSISRKEIVIENDIQWRIDTMIDYLFGQPIVIDSTAADACRARQIGTLLRHILAGAGGITLLQQLALMGAVYGFVDVVVTLDNDALRKEQAPEASSSQAPSPEAASRCGVEDLGEPAIDSEHKHDPSLSEPASSSAAASSSGAGETCLASTPHDQTSRPAPGASAADRDGAIAGLARCVRIDLVEPARALPFACPTDFRRLNAYAICTLMQPDAASRAPDDGDLPAHGGLWGRFLRSKTGRFLAPRDSRRADDGSGLLIDLYTPTQVFVKD